MNIGSDRPIHSSPATNGIGSANRQESTVKGCRVVRSANFQHLYELATDRHAIERTITLLVDAERFHDASPQVAIYLCRAAVEVLCRAIESDRNSTNSLESFQAQSERFDRIISDCERRKEFREAQVWKQFRSRNSHWDRVVHAGKVATTSAAIADLHFWHQSSWRLCFLRNPSLGEHAPTYVPTRGLLGELESYRSGDYIAILEGRLQEESELRKHVEKRFEDAEGRLREAEQNIQYAHSAFTKLEQTIPHADASALQGQLSEKAEEIRELEARKAELQRECERLREDAERSDALRGQFSIEIERLMKLENSKDDEISKMRLESERIAREQAARAEQELAAARLEKDDLQRRHLTSPYSAQLQELLLRSEQRVQTLVERERSLAREVERYQGERAKALQLAGSLEDQVRQLRTEIAREAAERTQLERAEARRRRYEDEYPGISQAHLFFDAAIDGDEEGALPPLSGFVNFSELGVDRYARRLEATHAMETCDDERCRAWGVEQWNLSRMDMLLGRPGIARLVASGQEGKPGFSAFVRAKTPLLSMFGASGRTLRLSTALRFGQGLIGDLASRTQARMSVSWPDVQAIGVRQEAALLLEPTAPHFGDLGPPAYLDKPVNDCVELTRAELEAGWAFAVAHATLRVIGALPASASSALSTWNIEEHWLRLHLEECRRACDEPIALSPLKELAGALIAALHRSAAKRPSLDEILSAIRGPLCSS
jgi:hypothetical protein